MGVQNVLAALAMTFVACLAHGLLGGGPGSTMLGACVNGLAASLVLLALHRWGWRRLVAVGATLVAVAIWDAMFRWRASAPGPEVDPVRVLSLDALGPGGMVAALVLLAAAGAAGRAARALAVIASLALLGSWLAPQSFASDVLSANGPGAEVLLVADDGRLVGARWERIVVTGVPLLLLPDRIANEWRIGEIARGMATAADPGHEALRALAWLMQRALSALALGWGAALALAAPLAVALRWRLFPVLLALGCALPFLADLLLVLPAIFLPEGAPLPLLAWSLLGSELVALAWSAARPS